eukprot:SAG31_NODE_4721_length_3007_cov_5.646836_4_plen_95_part_00
MDRLGGELLSTKLAAQAEASWGPCISKIHSNPSCAERQRRIIRLPAPKIAKQSKQRIVTFGILDERLGLKVAEYGRYDYFEHSICARARFHYVG